MVGFPVGNFKCRGNEVVHQGLPIEEIPEYHLVPRGSTALLDAVGRAINETDERLAGMEESERPGLVVFVIVTDGHENSSREFTKPQIKKIIENRQDRCDWQFTFLGANQDAFAEAGHMGIRRVGVAYFTADRFYDAYLGSSGRVSRMRQASSMGADFSDIPFSEQEVNAMKDTTARSLMFAIIAGTIPADIQRPRPTRARRAQGLPHERAKECARRVRQMRLR